MRKIVFATKNKGKLRELKALLTGTDITVLSLDDYPDIPEIVEDGTTFFENALKKARALSEYTGEVVIADDSGLEVDALGGKPGVHSARYARPGADDNRNNQKLLEELRDIPEDERGAAFKCVLVLYRTDGTYMSFEGTLRGRITFDPAGDGGFGYDPVFFVEEYGRTVAELAPDTKNRISHRAKAFNKLKKSLQQDSK
ncbi:MAG: XTP/dITP diphosphatase [Deltaproteobacteria bacterium]|nr:XTP/dITP diphosphatase [Deltaproteobacteria bacterium]